jgi:uncharacterized membrane protein YphA (DoxX/SURF4 family)
VAILSHRLGKTAGHREGHGFLYESWAAFPNVTAYVVGTSECVGGVLLFFGLGSRLISLPLLADMIGAYVTADREALKAIFSEPGKFYAADPYTFLFASLLILVFGPGKISVDALIERLIRREKRVLVGPSSSIALAGR